MQESISKQVNSIIEDFQREFDKLDEVEKSMPDISSISALEEISNMLQEVIDNFQELIDDTTVRIEEIETALDYEREDEEFEEEDEPENQE